MNGNSVFGQIQRQRLRQPYAAKLRRAVAGVVFAAHFSRFGVDLNDAPLNAVADHQTGKLTGAEEVAYQIHLQGAVKIPQLDIADKRRFGNPGTIDQQVGTAKNLVYPAGQRHDALLAGGIGTKPVCHSFTKFGVDGIRHAGGFFTLNIHYRHAVTFCGKPTAEKLS